MNGKQISISAGIGAALLGVLCCVGPLIAILLGIGGAGMLLGLHRYQPLLIATGLLVLIGAAWLSVRRHHRCCAVRNPGQEIRIVVSVFAIGFGSYLFLQLAVVPALSAAASRSIQPHSSAVTATDETATLTLEIDGMTCAGCAVGLEQNLLAVPGVKAAHVNWEDGTGTVCYDPSQTEPMMILQASSHPEYNLKTGTTQKTKGE